MVAFLADPAFGLLEIGNIRCDPRESGYALAVMNGPEAGRVPPGLVLFAHVGKFQCFGLPRTDGVFDTLPQGCFEVVRKIVESKGPDDIVWHPGWVLVGVEDFPIQVHPADDSGGSADQRPPLGFGTGEFRGALPDALLQLVACCAQLLLREFFLRHVVSRSDDGFHPSLFVQQNRCPVADPDVPPVGDPPAVLEHHAGVSIRSLCDGLLDCTLGAW